MMRLVDLTMPSPQENLALDEALLDDCEENASHEILRFWMPEEYFVVLGYSNKIAAEVNLPYCRANSIPVLRRISGGGTVLQGPGCLNYSLILDSTLSSELATITRTNQYIMERNRRALERLTGRPVEVKGDTDLVTGNLKFSGNAQRRRRRFLLFHGTCLLNFDVEMIERTLLMPERRPEYRQSRSHREFVTCLKLESGEIKKALAEEWGASGSLASPPLKTAVRLAREQYLDPEWISKF